jgi:drug/metabolite transporter (DMT)-like permease
MNASVYLWLILSSLFYAGGEYYSKKWADNSTAFNLAMLFVTYILGACAWLPAIKETKLLAVTGMFWLLFAIFAAVGLGVFVFGEKLSVTQVIGVVLAVIACILLEMK